MHNKRRFQWYHFTRIKYVSDRTIKTGQLTNYEKIAEACKDLTVGKIYTTHELIEYIRSKTGIKEKSVLPSDYCYNRIKILNDGRTFLSMLKEVNLHIWVKDIHMDPQM